VNIIRLSRTYKSAKRFTEIVNVFLKHGFGQVIEQIHLGKYIPFKKRLKAFGVWPSLKEPNVPERLRMAFAELGPTFIKLAQVLSSRPDLITIFYANEFKKLQDEVPPFPVSQVRKIIEEETGRPMDTLFSRFDELPIAAASIAQVHRATLLDGSDVIIKVQRPGIREAVEADINILSTVARLLDKYVPDSRFFNPTGIVEEFSRTIKKEMDFSEEARSCMRFRKNFEHYDKIYIPRIYNDLVSGKVLVMERIEGIRIDDIEKINALGYNRKDLAKIGVDSFYKQVLEDGFFHADPHPGNIMVVSPGILAYVDFGIMGRVSDELKETMANTFIALMQRDFDKLIDQYIELGIVPEHADLEDFRREFKTDLMDFLDPLYGATLKEINFAQYLDTLTRLAIKHNMKIPSDLLLINKSMLVLENIGRQLDPEFDFFSSAEPYATKIIRNRISPSRFYNKAKRNVMEIADFAYIFPRQMRQIVKKVLKDDLQVKMYHVNLPEFMRDMDKASNRIAFAMIISAMILSSAIMHATGVGPKLFGFSIIALISFGFAFLFGVWLIISIIRSGRL
jgi:ubiquinone biosynthesis protein